MQETWRFPELPTKQPQAMAPAPEDGRVLQTDSTLREKLPAAFK